MHAYTLTRTRRQTVRESKRYMQMHTHAHIRCFRHYTSTSHQSKAMVFYLLLLLLLLLLLHRLLLLLSWFVWCFFLRIRRWSDSTTRERKPTTNKKMIFNNNDKKRTKKKTWTKEAKQLKIRRKYWKRIAQTKIPRDNLFNYIIFDGINACIDATVLCMFFFFFFYFLDLWWRSKWHFILRCTRISTHIA